MNLDQSNTLFNASVKLEASCALLSAITSQFEGKDPTVVAQLNGVKTFISEAEKIIDGVIEN